jgi:hypothetical protein
VKRNPLGSEAVQEKAQEQGEHTLGVPMAAIIPSSPLLVLLAKTSPDCTGEWSPVCPRLQQGPSGLAFHPAVPFLPTVPVVGPKSLQNWLCHLPDSARLHVISQDCINFHLPAGFPNQQIGHHDILGDGGIVLEESEVQGNE